MTEREARAALSRLSEPGDLRMAGVVAELGAVRVYDLLRAEQDVRGVYTDVAERLRGLDPEKELATAAERGIRFVCPGDDEWPEQVDALARAGAVEGRGGVPLGLWVKGPLSLAEATRRSVAVVGSRSATTYGADVTGQVAAHIAGTGAAVVSGAAFGIDVAAHRAALAARGPTVAVLACGVDRVYPAGNQVTVDYIARTGAVVSELPPGCAPTRVRFLTRNRVIAALAQGTVVVEAAARSGALNTANWTGRLGRVLMGVPGPVTSAPSEGVHELLRSGAAHLVTRGEHVLELVSPMGEALAERVRGEERPRDRLGELQRRVLEAVPAVLPAAPESVARAAGTPLAGTRRALRELESGGFVREVDGRWHLDPDSSGPLAG